MDFNNIYSQYFPFWNELSQTDIDFLIAHSSKVMFDKEQSVHDNTECSGLYIVKSGRLRLYMLSILSVKKFLLSKSLHWKLLFPVFLMLCG